MKLVVLAKVTVVKIAN